MTRIEVNRDRMEQHLRTQYGYLTRSGALFDQGHPEEAHRLAVTLRVLCHEGRGGKRASVSLLRHLGIKETLTFLDTGISKSDIEARRPPVPEGYFLATDVHPSQVGLVAVGHDHSGMPGWVAPLHRSRAPMPTDFDAWWTRPLVMSSTGRQFSRWDLINVMANQDGGGHVDGELDEDYDSLTVDSLGLMLPMLHEAHGNHVDSPPPSGWHDVSGNVAGVSIRQIAYEMIMTLDNAGLPGT